MVAQGEALVTKVDELMYEFDARGLGLRGKGESIEKIIKRALEKQW